MTEYTLRTYIFNKYDIEYNDVKKILYIHNPVDVSEMGLIRFLCREYDYQDIRVESRSRAILC